MRQSESELTADARPAQAMGGAVQRVVEAIAGLSSAEPADPLSAVVQALTGEVGRAAASAGSETLAI